MHSGHILRHSIRQVMRNLGPSALTSIPLFLALILLTATFFAPYGISDATLVGTTFLLFLGWAWTAVNWHRFVLLEEMPTSIPRWKGDRILAYAGRSIQFGFCMAAILAPFMILSIVIIRVAESPLPGFFLMFPVILLLVVGGMRLSVMMPAAAVGRGFGPVEAWRRTEGTSGTLVVVAILFWLIQVVLGLIQMAAETTIVLFPVSLFISWLVAMFTISLTTTLYGHYIEGRPLV